MLFSIIFLNIDPVAINIGVISIRWYGISYVLGILIGIWLLKYMNKPPAKFFVNDQLIDNLALWIIIGVLLGGRLGYIVFYYTDIIFLDWLEIFKIWHGGMSFHGGMIGVFISIFLYCRHYQLNLWPVIDRVVCVIPIGLFLGRMANFINGELVGRPGDIAWSIVFPHVDMLPRHPTQIYEALAEGIIILLIMLCCFYKYQMHKKETLLTGIFCLSYSIIRIFIEFFRQPDSHIGFIMTYFTMGQILSLPILGIGIYLLSKRKSN